MKYFESDEELKEFMEYFKDELPNPDHHPHKVMWLDDKKFQIHAGQLVLIEDGVFHKVEAGDKGVYFVCIFDGNRKH